MVTLTELQIEIACTQILELDGWRTLKTDPVSDRMRGKGFGEKGMADRVYIRYLDKAEIVYESADRAFSFTVVLKPPAAEVMWIEWKRIDAHGRTTKAKQHQKDWHLLERKRGALTLIVGEDFPASIEGFKDWYRNSGLMRKAFK